MMMLMSPDEPPHIPGMIYEPSFITPAEENNLLQVIDQQNWGLDLKRRTQHYGYRYDYKARTADQSLYLGPLPHWLMPCMRGLTNKGYFREAPDQVIINEYLPGQGISAHIDCVPCFGETIASLSLGSACVMDFDRGEKKISLPLMPASLIVLSGSARYEWRHGIAARKSDMIDGVTTPRGRRVSLTFRTMSR